jgi:hemerythrin-like domain-containing protein
MNKKGKKVDKRKVSLEEKLKTIEEFIERVQTHLETEEAILLYKIEKPTEEELSTIQVKNSELDEGEKDE